MNPSVPPFINPFAGLAKMYEGLLNVSVGQLEGQLEVCEGQPEGSDG